MSNIKIHEDYFTSEDTAKYIKDVVGRRKDQFITNCISIISNDTKLQECEPESVMYAALKATALNLPLDSNLGHAYVLPYNVKTKVNGKDVWSKKAQLQIGWKGFYQLAIRTNKFDKINVSDVREGEICGIDRMTGEHDFCWKTDEERESAKVVGYLAFFSLMSGFSKSIYMTIKELESHGQTYSKTYQYDSSTWKKNFEAMASKTVLKRLLSKYAPLSMDSMSVVNEAIRVDQGVIHLEEVSYPDNDDVDESKLERLAIPVETKEVPPKTLKDGAFEHTLNRFKKGEVNVFEDAKKAGYALTPEQSKKLTEAQKVKPQ